ncbi:hypothetical protein MNBD_GAMMA11-814 [hydrothermal vent metagenome]|uniref:Uncharacterized protein n=1 Tax=hydrothermal vent metagenome TaxID=652676 RepID=A0A3B0XSD5_9ZZZZ
MSRYVFLRVFVFSLLAVLGGIYLSSFQPPASNSLGYPWQIERLASGHTQVFKLILGQSSINDAQLLFKEEAEITLFVPTDIKHKSADSVSGRASAPVVEAFFSQVKTGGLKARMVMSIDIPENEINALYQRGVRVATLQSGIRKVTLSDVDALAVRARPITSITYLPSINLSASLIEKRFGPPAAKRADPESDAIHWLYPEQGVDIALSETHKEVIQYVEPARFGELVRLLKAVK